jgi:hypothetical protein
VEDRVGRVDADRPAAPDAIPSELEALADRLEQTRIAALVNRERTSADQRL